jgi:hypothetical protein
VARRDARLLLQRGGEGRLVTLGAQLLRQRAPCRRGRDVRASAGGVSTRIAHALSRR